MLPHAAALASSLPMVGPGWLDPDTLIASFGPYALGGVVLVVFIETGLLFPFLPGDSLLFTAGMLTAQEQITVPIWLLCTLLFLAAFLGDQVAYMIGAKAGPRIFNRPDSRFFKQSYIDMTNAYFDKYGGRTIIIARFVPFVRTYAPVAAGVGKMRYRRFVSYNVIGALLWGVGVTLLGYALGNVPFVKDNLEALVLAIVFVSVLPIVIEVWRARRDRIRSLRAAEPDVTPGPGTAIEEPGISPTES